MDMTASILQDPDSLEEYAQSNVFLAALNNEGTVKDGRLRHNLASLERLVLFRFGDDYTVVPRDSAWFGGFYKEKWRDMQKSELYQVGSNLACIFYRFKSRPCISAIAGIQPFQATRQCISALPSNGHRLCAPREEAQA